MVNRLLPLIGLSLLYGFAAEAGARDPAYVLQDALPGMKFDQPVALVAAPGDSERLYVVEKTGRVQAVSPLAQPGSVKSIFLDLSEPADGALVTEGECGTLGLAFHPQFPRNRTVFVCYSLIIDGALHQRVSRFRTGTGPLSTAPVQPGRRVETGPVRVDPASEQPLWTQRDPANNHNGGDLKFGPDGFLYVSIGDGGAANDVFNNAGFIDKGFHAGIFRIDVDKQPGSLLPNPHPGIARDAEGGAFYAVPPDNPFVGAREHRGRPVDPQTVRTEIWATGLRNVWRFSFDPPTGRLFAADVGQNLFEEVDIMVKGGDYGWSLREGMHRFSQGPDRGKEPVGFHPIDPIFEYPRNMGISVTGGIVYRHGKEKSLEGAYLCADYGTGVILALREEEGKWREEILAREPGIAAIGVNPLDGEPLFASLARGLIFKLEPATPRTTGR